MISVGIVGLPNVGKSTLFKALTKKQVDISNYPFCTIEPNVGVVVVPDERLQKIAKVTKPQKITPTIIEFIDIAGLVKGAHKGEGLGNQFLARIREVDIICQIIRNFQNEKIIHVDGSINPKRDIETINLELIMKDLETIDKRLEKTSKEAKGGNKEKIKELEQLKELKNWLNTFKLIKDLDNLNQYEPIIKELSFLTAKPAVYIANIKNEKNGGKTIEINNIKAIALDLKYEEELSELSEAEIIELNIKPSSLDLIIRICYDTLELITFYTVVGGKELRAWTITKETKAPKAAGKIHGDFEKGFICADVVDWQELIEAGSPSKAREKGFTRTEGKDYIIQDGDVVEFKFKV